MARIQITNLKLRTIIGANDWERTIKQDIVLNIIIDFDATMAIETDDLAHTFDYKKIKREIVNFVDSSQFHLLERLTSEVLDLIMADPKVEFASVRIDKSNALRYADSVSIELSKHRGQTP
ncbi:MAG TPA: dihydroneopterin aldolase [Candidatus Omnitrophota bacterium]|jgi:D-erythro-7,8-dihydroneopterin triphosphate epimerase|nr:dihydroneopterin aldolase [Candidatus Omnitrophota bacterium]HSA31458.1 dihydroneopterin aldolase [Candidatus Omnitrophota bacterium]